MKAEHASTTRLNELEQPLSSSSSFSPPVLFRAAQIFGSRYTQGGVALVYLLRSLELAAKTSQTPVPALICGRSRWCWCWCSVRGINGVEVGQVPPVGVLWLHLLSVIGLEDLKSIPF